VGEEVPEQDLVPPEPQHRPTVAAL
jgi:hypothetical protein